MHPVFQTQFAVRERFNILKAKIEAKNREEAKAPGIAPDPLTEVEMAVEEIIEQIKEHEKKISEEDTAKSNKFEVEKIAAEDMRMQALETFASTRKRKENEGDGVKEKKRRSSGTPTIEYLREKSVADNEFWQQELELKKQQLELQKSQLDQMAQQQQQQNQQMMLILGHLINKTNFVFLFCL